MHHLSQINKVFIVPQPFNQHFYNNYKFTNISLSYKNVNNSSQIQISKLVGEHI